MGGKIVECCLHSRRIRSLRRNTREVLGRAIELCFAVLPEIVNLEEVETPLLEFEFLHKGGEFASGLFVSAPTIRLFRIPGAIARNLWLELYRVFSTDCVSIGFKTNAAIVEIADHELLGLDCSAALHEAVSVIERRSEEERALPHPRRNRAVRLECREPSRNDTTTCARFHGGHVHHGTVNASRKHELETARPHRTQGESVPKFSSLELYGRQ